MECVGSVSRENGRVIKSIGALWPVGVGARPGGSERERNVYSSEGMMRNATAKGIGNYEWFLRWSFRRIAGNRCLLFMRFNTQCTLLVIIPMDNCYSLSGETSAFSVNAKLLVGICTTREHDTTFVGNQSFATWILGSTFFNINSNGYQ